MSGLLVQVAVYGLAAALAAPMAIVVSALILGKSKRPSLSVWTFTAGAAFLNIVFAVVLLASGLFDEGGDAGAIVDVGLGIIFGAMGLLAVFGAESPEKDAARRARAEQIASAKLSTLFVTGIVVQVINFDAIAVFGGALKEIAEGDITTGEEILVTLFGLAIMLSVYYLPAVMYRLSPERAGPFLRRMSEWILGHGRQLEIVVGLGFGALFLWKGLAVLV